jgi:dienelactone hydrolase
MRNRLSLAPLSALLLLVPACAPSEPEPAADARPPLAASVITDVVYGHKDGLALTYDVYRPAATNGAGVISLESAGWRSSWGTLKQFVDERAGPRPMNAAEIESAGGYLPAHSYAGLLDNGFTVFSVRHGSSPRYELPDIVADVRRAVRHVRFNADRYGVSPDRIGVWGGSAGGHLALLLGTMAEPPIAEPGEAFESEPARVAAVVAYFPPTDLARWGTTQVRNQFPAVALDVDSAREYSPLHAVTPDDATSLILHGDMDELVPIEEGRTMFEALDASGVDADLVTIDGAGHGFFDEDATRANAAMVEWFVRHLAR